jgi:formylglycine-generating enzyme required for sulfatase activity
VSGVSWFEALAYCRSQSKTLPTVYHWARAALSPVEINMPLAPSIIPVSNFAGKGPAAVESYRGIGPYGTFDMAGSVREWIWNEAVSGRRWNLGGASSDPPYMFVMPTSVPPLDRSPANGLRCARYDEKRPLPEHLLAKVEGTRDNRTAAAVSDEVFAVFKRQLAYVRSPFDSRVESRDDSAPDWIKETLSFEAGYEDSRVRAYLALPRNAKPPYQLVVFFPGVGAFIGRSPSEPPFVGSPQRDMIVKSGRAFAMPVYKGSAERWDPFLTAQGDEYLRGYRTHFSDWRQELGRLLDVLTARPDIDRERIGYWGASFGTSSGSPLVALEDRIKVAVLAPGGFTFRRLPPEADAINYVSRITVPTLMIGGRHDYVFPFETSQKPMFERLGTPPDRKRHVIFDSGHSNFPRSEVIREVIGWLDKYLGPVNPGG